MSVMSFGRATSALGSALLGLALVVACSGAPTIDESHLPAGSLTIIQPATGAVVTTRAVTVRGRAPAGARVVRDISFAPDQYSIAGTDGTWEMSVELDEGSNDLVFRLGDDKSTELHLGLTYRAQPSPASAEPAGGEQSAPPAETSEPPEETSISAPTVAGRTFEDGTWQVKKDIPSGTYRLREPASFCYWARLKGFGGTLGDIIANENVNGYAVVSIKNSDKGFESSGCGEWSSDLSRVTATKSRFETDGTYIVGTDLLPGTWRSSGGDACYWARLRGFGGTLGDIIANANVFGRSTIVTIKSSDAGFLVNGCGTWKKQ